ncbi:MAG: 6-pyruvoyl tetrahydropterin synthase family protein [Pirellulales bacterium]|nr:6-pyruvoyl tetrahydropterin synthase family protein [Pirellulales bacterium]
MQRFHVRIAKDDLAFSAAHFITFQGGVCERLHGHNYRVAAEVYGPLNESRYVVDFVALHDALRAIVEEWDHRVLLPAEHPTMRLRDDGQEIEVVFGGRRWVFPREDCLLLPIANTTAELLARLTGQRLLDVLSSRCGTRSAEVQIEIEESRGVSAVCRLHAE